MREWYQYSHLTLSKKANKRISQYIVIIKNMDIKPQYHVAGFNKD